MERIYKKGLSINAKRNIIGYSFVAPAIIFFVVFTIIPLIMSVYLSLYSTNIYFIDMEYVGLDNFSRIFSDTQFWTSIKNILFYTAMAVPLNITLSLIMAMLTNTNLKGTKIFRFIYYLPGVTSAVAASTVWLWLMNPSYGLLNNILTSLGLPPGTWLTHSKTALFSVTIVTVWMGVSSNMIVFLAALQNIPAQLYEAARLDGANKAVMFFKITLPIILPTMYFILTMTLIGAFQLYDQVFVLTQGGPGGATWTPVYLIWQNSFGNTASQAGYAASQSIVLFFIIMAVTLIVRRLDRDITK